MESYQSLSNASAKLNFATAASPLDHHLHRQHHNLHHNLHLAATVVSAMAMPDKTSGQQQQQQQQEQEQPSSPSPGQPSQGRMPLSRSLTQPQGTIEYMVTGSDTLASVAARFQTTPSELSRINKITGRFIFPGQVLFVPKRVGCSANSLDASGSGGGGGGGGGTDCNEGRNVAVPPNTPNDSSRTSSTNSESVPESPVPGQAKRILDSSGSLFPHPILHHTASSPFSTFNSTSPPKVPVFLAAQTQPQDATDGTETASTKPYQPVAIDPADRECLERFLKINVRHITDGQGVVGGVLLVTPNALMFDPNVSDPLVIEHGTEVYGVTVPMELVLKTALYSDIAHMRVKHAPEAVPMVPKPKVYYANDEDASCLFEDNLRQVYANKPKSSVTEQAVEVKEDECAQEALINLGTDADQAEEEEEEEESSGDVFRDAVDHIEESQERENVPLVTSCDDVPPETCLDSEQGEGGVVEEIKQEPKLEVNAPNEEEESNVNESVDVDESIAEITESLDSFDQFDQSKSVENASIDDISSQYTPPNSAGARPNRLSSHFQTKLALGERHSAPLASGKKEVTPPLVTAVSAEENMELGAVNKRLSAHGESRREQMLKRLSNPVDTIGNLTKSGISTGINATKSGFNATKSGISTGLNVTKTGISSGIMATKTGLTTGLSVTKTGFNKVLSTPKNLMDFSSGLVRDAKGALGSKSDYNLNEHLNETSPTVGFKGSGKLKFKEPTLGYTNMVDTKINAFENFDKLIPRPARMSKDAPLYLCIRMGKYKRELKKSQRFSSTYSFGKKKYEREYWFSVPKEKSKNLYHFFKKWAPEIYGDVDDLAGCEERGLEPLTTDDELDEAEDETTSLTQDGASSDDSRRRSSAAGRGGSGSIGGGDARHQGSLDAESAKEENANGGKMISSSSKPRFWRRRSPLNFLKLVEDHFSTDGMSTDWNVSNSSEEHSFSDRYLMEVSNEPIMPDINGHTELLTTDIIQNLLKHLPARAEGYAWTLIYSTSTHGFSLNTLYRDMKQYDSPVLFIVEDTNGAKFGALLSTTLQLSDHFYGTGETFLFTFYPEFECYPWTGENLFFIKGNPDSISIGAGEGTFGLWLDGDLYHGSSHPCKTFGNRTLSSEKDFYVKSIECWGFM